MKKPLLHPKYTVIAVAGYLLHTLLFFLIATLVPLRWEVHIPLDDCIPFCDWFVIPYVLWYLFFAATAVFFLHIAAKSAAHARECVQYFVFIFGGCALTLITFVAIPNGVTFRPAVDAMDTSRPLTALAALLFTADKDARNVFPSLHCLVQLTCTIALLKCSFFTKKQRRVVAAVTLPLTVLVFLSTAFVRQHSVLDMLGALVYGAVLYPLSYKVPWKFLPKTSA